ncbi:MULTISPECIES: sigma-54-dependent transcriptional regulator [Syntrophotalea]|uniref:AAA family ATPase n=1 Tax=Syntrophotalea acetylenica TaxID=29542 RepID=A0A1L3GF98_SYNAC|nr:sigma-54 dependent transcriptional regulator [Syntrophotalea acetylenica]APG24626.1 AAA family ATPase [Syntrophotalea acetylenica]APG45208.1 AAA family ATPase [Syntrophotalea acetylenica]MDY0262219.1 sigma-54 dependent transcriptional regulator [Syntrophotalea acetylenica]
MSKVSVLIIDDEESVCTFFRRLLQRKGYRTVTAVNEEEALRALDCGTYNVAMVDLKLPDTDGLTLLKHIKARQPACEVIIMTGFSTIKTAVQAMQLGAYEYLEKPFEDIKLIERLIEKATAVSCQGPREEEEEWSELAKSTGFLVGNCPDMRHLVSLAYKIAPKDISVLIQGETGTGKEVLARFIHTASARSDQMFIPINCGALSDNLLESELFGHERGSFTGAGNMRRGIFEMANKGTLFLDEIGEASLAIQVKLLRVLETGEFMRLGGEKQIHCDVRVISASNVDLEEAMLRREFREDLFYRLNVVKLVIPPLRSRAQDIPMLARYFVKQFNPTLTLSEEILDLLCQYDWPGNIRELSNTLRQAVALCDGKVILPEHFSGKLTASKPRSAAQNGQQAMTAAPACEVSSHQAQPPMERFWEHYGTPEALSQLSDGELTQLLNSLRGLEANLYAVMRQKGLSSSGSEALRDSEAASIKRTLLQHRWNITEAARSLGIARNTLHRKIKKYGLQNQ